LTEDEMKIAREIAGEIATKVDAILKRPSAKKR